MDDKLFDIFSEETEVPECVLRRVDETVEMIENSAESDKGHQRKNWYTEKLEAQFDPDICGSDGIWCHCFCSREVYRNFRIFPGSWK